MKPAWQTEQLFAVEQLAQLAGLQLIQLLPSEEGVVELPHVTH